MTRASKPPPQGPPPARSRGAAAALRGLLPRAADDVVATCSVGAMWAANATGAASIAARRAFGAESRVTAVAKKFFMASAAATVLLVFFILLTLAWRLGNRKRREVGEVGGESAAQGESTGDRTWQDELCAPLTAQISCLLWMFVIVGLLMEVLASSKGSCAAKLGSVLGDIGCFINALMFCSIIVPNYVSQQKWGTAELHRA